MCRMPVTFGACVKDLQIHTGGVSQVQTERLNVKCKRPIKDLWCWSKPLPPTGTAQGRPLLRMRRNEPDWSLARRGVEWGL